MAVSTIEVVEAMLNASGQVLELGVESLLKAVESLLDALCSQPMLVASHGFLVVLRLHGPRIIMSSIPRHCHKERSIWWKVRWLENYT
jgi:hypothetical protein